MPAAVNCGNENGTLNRTGDILWVWISYILHPVSCDYVGEGVRQKLCRQTSHGSVLDDGVLCHSLILKSKYHLFTARHP